jgi:hypothetical protein
MYIKEDASLESSGTIMLGLVRAVHIHRMTVYLVISLPKIRIYTVYIYMVLANPMMYSVRLWKFG